MCAATEDKTAGQGLITQRTVDEVGPPTAPGHGVGNLFFGASNKKDYKWDVFKALILFTLGLVLRMCRSELTTRRTVDEVGPPPAPEEGACSYYESFEQE
jgi:hypothetical protein